MLIITYKSRVLFIPSLQTLTSTWHVYIDTHLASLKPSFRLVVAVSIGPPLELWETWKWGAGEASSSSIDASPFLTWPANRSEEKLLLRLSPRERERKGGMREKGGIVHVVSTWAGISIHQQGDVRWKMMKQWCIGALCTFSVHHVAWRERERVAGLGWWKTGHFWWLCKDCCRRYFSEMVLSREITHALD